MKKLMVYSLAACLMFITIVPCGTNVVEAKTLQQYKNAVAELEKKKDNTDRLTAAAEQQIRTKRNAIANANSTIKDNEKSVEKSKKLVAESEEKIKIKNNELEDVIRILQYTGNNNDEMMDYVFESSSIYELMERQSVVEQIIDYTIEELESLEKLIDENKKLQTQLVKDNKKKSSKKKGDE
jgi:peptidoglycan hydrolase CwlO-like protein